MSKNTKLFLIFHGRFPSEKAHALFTAKSAEAFSKVGLPVTVLVPRRFDRVSENVYSFYHLEPNFNVVWLPTIDLFKFPVLKVIAFRLSFIMFSFSTLVYLLFKAKKTDVIYSNESLSLYLLSWFYSRTVYEVHDFPESNLWFYKRLIKRLKVVVATNDWKRDALRELFPTEKDKMISEINGVDLEEFATLTSREEARTILGLDQSKTIVVYTGHLYGWKGVDTLAEAAKLLPAHYQVVFVGGTTEDVAKFKSKYGTVANVTIVGHKARSEMPVWQKAADVLVLPNTAKEKISLYYTSPMKLFEYMVSDRPIVASDIPSIRNIVDETSVWFFKADDSRDLARVIELAKEGDEAKTQHALQVAKNHTWEERAKRLKEAVGSLLGITWNLG